jgi:ketosteroid isomerase-like protein
MTREQAVAYAHGWAEAWNRRHLDEVLSHFDDEVVFTSPQALQSVGTPTVRGKDALRAYWQSALGCIGSLRFDVIRVLWDGDTRELAIVYDRVADGQEKRVAEVLQFGADDRVVRGEVLHGAIPC